MMRPHPLAELTMNGREEGVDQILIEALILAHLVNLRPLVFSHLFTNHLCGQFLAREVTTSEL